MAKKKAAKKATDERKKPKKRPIEQYDHSDEKRVNNPQVGLVTPETDPDAGRKSYQYDPHLDPQLVWAGKAEHTSFEVPTVSLHVHERIDPKTIIQAVRKRNGNGNNNTVSGSLPAPGRAGEGRLRQQSFLFEQPEENPPIRDAVEFYQHQHNWSNRLIAGDSLLVMNSLLEKEGMAGKVQMVYIDPPYGIRYGSNFQPFVNRRDVKDGRDEDLTQEPETIRAFRDTWELGIHSYLTYLRDRLLLARELLNESGSVFVQISDENLHHVRELMEEVFGSKNAIATIPFVKTAGLGATGLPVICDYLIWFGRNVLSTKYHQLFKDRQLGDSGADQYGWIEIDYISRRRMTAAERRGDISAIGVARVFRLDNLTSGAFRENTTIPYKFENVIYHPGENKCWKTTKEGLDRLSLASRLRAAGKTLSYVRFIDDFPALPIKALWTDTGTGGFGEDKVYVVQTTSKPIQRCLLMTTDPGDLVFDATCGSGTTACVAEQWGRRWITCDTSRVAVTLAKQRLMTAVFDYYQLAHPEEGVGSGFVYKTVPHVTLKSIANNPEIRPGMTRDEVDAAIAKYAEQETLYDQPLPDKSKARVTGPFTVEAVPAATVKPLDAVGSPEPLEVDAQPTLPGVGPLDGQRRLETAVARSGETVRQAEWRDELLKTGIRGRGGQRIEFSRVEVLGGTRWLHADAETKSPLPNPPRQEEGAGPQRAVISFGPEHAPLEQKQVARALEEAETLRPKPKLIIFAAFQFDPEAAKDIDETNWPGVTLLKAQMNADMLTDDLKKKRTSNDSYWLIGQPDVELLPLPPGEGRGEGALYRVAIHGFDYYNTRTGTIESGDTGKIAMWMLDTNYDGRSLYPRQVFFPMAGEKDGWARLAKNLKAEVDEELIEEYRGTTSLPFAAGEHGRVAVKIIDDRGIESLRIMPLG
jgi:adenine-specific DNA-methyltransferase